MSRHYIFSTTTKNIVTEDGRRKGVVMANSSGGNARYWVGILYPENMVEDWQDKIGDIVELPFAYCIHDKDLDNDDDERKVHVHLILAYPNTTTYNNMFTVFSKLNAEGKRAVNKIEKIINIRHKFNYLIHDTERCRKDNKYLYPKSERITGNCFDIGAYEQLDQSEKDRMLQELAKEICDKNFTNFSDFYLYVLSNFEDTYFQIVKGYSGFLERLTKGNYQREVKKFERKTFD